ncbi:hypothetical protein N9W41_01245, partial [bacterium]|nr:hypothetical protein [bacterium]
MKNTMKVLLLIVFGFVLLNADSSYAKKKKKKGKRSQWAYTAIDGAAVYQDANFDSEIVTYLPENKKYKVSKKKYLGITGFGSFYKIKYAKKKYGYISDVDLRLTKKASKSESSIYDIDKDDNSDEGMPFLFNKYIGASTGVVNIAEKYEGRVLSSPTNVIGIKVTGPEILLPQPLDYEILFSMAPPKYFEEFSSKTTGLFILAHVATNVPMIMRDRFYLYYGFGISALFTMFKNTMPAPLGEVDNQKLALGVDIPLGVAFKVSSRFAVKLEAKYYI